MDFKAGIGTLTCRLCTANYQMPIHHLHEPIDVFSEWLDDCEAAQNPNSSSNAAAATTTYDDGDDDDDDDDLPESSGLGQRKPSAKPSATNAASRNDNNARSIDLGDEDSDDDDDE